MISYLLDFLLPRYCIGCGRRLINQERHLCLHCLIKLPRTGLWKNPENNALARNFWGRTGEKEVEKVVAFLGYGKTTTVGKIVHAFKYRNERQLAYDMGRLMAQELRETGFFDNIDCLIPVPLTFWRRMRRGYNQSECLAQGLGKEVELAVCTGVIARRRFKRSQTLLMPQERQENVKGSFFVDMKRAENLKGKHILLIDDVITTGATTRECVRQLAKIPDTKISVLAFSTVQTGGLRIEIDKK